MDKLTVAQLDKLKDRWTESGLQLPTQQQVWLVITSFINTMRDLQVYDATTALQIPKKINAKRRREKFLEESQIDDLLDNLKSIDRMTWYQCCIITYAGLRTDEVKRLRPVDISLEERKIRIPEIKSATNQAKSDWVPIDDNLYPILEEMLLSLSQEPAEPFFKSWFNYRIWHKACKRMGLNDGLASFDFVNRITPYTLRHHADSRIMPTNRDKSGAFLTPLQFKSA